MEYRNEVNPQEEIFDGRVIYLENFCCNPVNINAVNDPYQEDCFLIRRLFIDDAGGGRYCACGTSKWCPR